MCSKWDFDPEDCPLKGRCDCPATCDLFEGDAALVELTRELKQDELDKLRKRGEKVTQKMFRRGETYTDISDFISDYKNGESSRYAFYAHKLMHVNFVGGMNLNTIVSTINKRVLFRAIRNNITGNKAKEKGGKD